MMMGIAAGAGVAVAVALGTTIGKSDDATVANAAAVNGPIEGPCSGTEIDLAKARRAVPFKLYGAHHPLADDDNLVRVWDCPGPMVALEYGSDVTVYLSANTLDAPEAVWAQMAAQYEEFSTGTSRGKLASFSDPYQVENGTAAGGVDLVEHGIRITVSGDGSIALGDLKEVMESLRQEE